VSFLEFQKLARTARVKSVKTRIAGALGITSPPVGRTIPMLKSERHWTARAGPDALASSFSIFEPREQLMHFEEYVALFDALICRACTFES